MSNLEFMIYWFSLHEFTREPTGDATAIRWLTTRQIFIAAFACVKMTVPVARFSNEIQRD